MTASGGNLVCPLFPRKVVFARPGDLQLLGARTLEGFNAVVDSRRKRLVAAGPIAAA